MAGKASVPCSLSPGADLWKQKPIYRLSRNLQGWEAGADLCFASATMDLLCPLVQEWKKDTKSPTSQERLLLEAMVVFACFCSTRFLSWLPKKNFKDVFEMQAQWPVKYIVLVHLSDCLKEKNWRT